MKTCINDIHTIDRTTRTVKVERCPGVAGPSGYCADCYEAAKRPPR